MTLPEKRNLTQKSPLTPFVKKEIRVTPILDSPNSNLPNVFKKEVLNPNRKRNIKAEAKLSE